MPNDLRTLSRALAVAAPLFVAIAFASTPAATAATSAYSCEGDQVTLLDNSNGGVVSSGGGAPTFSTSGTPFCLTYLQTYHWNNGKGATPGRLGVTIVGTPQGKEFLDGTFSRTARFPAKGSAGQNNAPNVNWYADVPTDKPVIINGSYQCYDSGAATWSADAESGGEGFCIVRGVTAVKKAAAAATTVPATTASTTATTAPGKGGGGGGSSSWPLVLVALGVLAAGAIALAARQMRSRHPQTETTELDDGHRLLGNPSPLFGDEPDVPGSPPGIFDADIELPVEPDEPTQVVGDLGGPVDENP